MKKKTNIKTIIRTMVREEVAMAINEVITELKQPTQPVSQPQPVQSKQQPKIVQEKKSYSSNSVLNDILNETAQEEEWKTLGGGTYDSSRAGEVLTSQYGNMMNNDDSGQPNVQVDGITGDAPGMDFLKKDYRQVLKKVEEKAKQTRG